MNLDLDSILSSDHVLIAGTVAAVLLFIVLFIMMARQKRWGAVIVLACTGFGIWWLLLYLGLAVFILPFILLGGLLDGIQWRVRTWRLRRAPSWVSSCHGRSALLPREMVVWVQKNPINPDDFKDFQNQIVPPDEYVLRQRNIWTPTTKVDQYMPVTIEIPGIDPAEIAALRKTSSDASRSAHQPLVSPPIPPRSEPRESPLYWGD